MAPLVLRSRMTGGAPSTRSSSCCRSSMTNFERWTPSQAYPDTVKTFLSRTTKTMAAPSAATRWLAVMPSRAWLSAGKSAGVLIWEFVSASKSGTSSATGARSSAPAASKSATLPMNGLLGRRRRSSRRESALTVAPKLPDICRAPLASAAIQGNSRQLAEGDAVAYGPRPVSARRRLLTVGHSYVIGVNRRLAHELGRVGGAAWEVTCVAPAKYRADHGWARFAALPHEPVRALGVRAYATRSPHLF